MFRSLQLALHERFVDNELGGDIGEFAPLPRLHLLAHRLKVPLHAIDTHRNVIDQRERLRVFREHRREHTRDNVAKLSTALTCDPFIPGPPAMFPIYRTRASNSHGLK